METNLSKIAIKSILATKFHGMTCHNALGDRQFQTAEEPQTENVEFRRKKFPEIFLSLTMRLRYYTRRSSLYVSLYELFPSKHRRHLRSTYQLGGSSEIPSQPRIATIRTALSN